MIFTCYIRILKYSVFLLTFEEVYEKSTLADALIRNNILLPIFEKVLPIWIFFIKNFFFMCSQFVGVIRK